MKVRSCAALAATLVALATLPTALAADARASTVVAPTASLSQVQVETPTGAPLSLQFATPFTTAKDARRVLARGAGPSARHGQRISFDYVIVNGRTGTSLEASPVGESGTFVLAGKQSEPFLADALVGARVGSQVLVALAPRSALAKRFHGKGVEPRDSLLVLFRVTEIHHLLARASGTPQPAGDPTLIPTVRLGAKGTPTVTMPGNNPPAQLVTQLLVKGDGPVVRAGDGITVHSLGVLWRNGKVFDSTWRTGHPADFTIGNGSVIRGWDSSLVGQTVGSQVLLVVPPDQGYGDNGNATAGIGGTDTLVFVVDILDRY